MLYAALLALFALGPVPAHAVDGVDVHAAAEATLALRYPDDAHRYEVRVVRTGGDVEAASEPLRVRFTGTGVPRAHTRVTVLTGSEEEGWREAGWALLYVAHFDSVVVARDHVRPAEPVSADDLTVAWVETTRFRGEPLRPDAFRSLAAGGEIFAEKPLRAGAPLRVGDLRGAYAAETGDAVQLVYTRGDVVLRLPCKAREAGLPGDIIRVYASDTRTNYRARLVEPGVAEWIETL